MTGTVENVCTGPDFIVRAYDAKKGKLLWQDQYDWDYGYDEACAITPLL